MDELVKIIVFVPQMAADKLRLAIGDANFGKIGNYSHCAFVGMGVGYFKPNDNANPTLGDTNTINAVAEAKLEFLCYKNEIQDALQVVNQHHPYEEVAIDIIPLLNGDYV
jgi:hypothetical protein